MPTSLAIAVKDRGVGGQVQHAAPATHPRRGDDPNRDYRGWGRPSTPDGEGLAGAEVGDGVHRVGRRATVAEYQHRAAGVQLVRGPRPPPPAPRGRRARSGRTQRRGLSALAPIDARTSASTAPRSVSSSAKNGYKKLEAPASWCSRVATREQAAMLEEDMHELPEHVVGRLHQLLGDERIAGRRNQRPLRRRPAPNASVSNSLCPRAATARSIPAPTPNAIAMSSRRNAATPPPRRAAVRTRQRPLADDHQVHELVPRRAARPRRSAADAPKRPAVRHAQALGHPVTQLRQLAGLGTEEPLAPVAVRATTNVSRRSTAGRATRFTPPALASHDAARWTQPWARARRSPRPCGRARRSSCASGWMHRLQVVEELAEVEVDVRAGTASGNTWLQAGTSRCRDGLSPPSATGHHGAVLAIRPRRANKVAHSRIIDLQQPGRPAPTAPCWRRWHSP